MSIRTASENHNAMCNAPVIMIEV